MTNEVQQIQTPKVKSYKYSKLVIGIFFDLIGMISYIIPGYLAVSYTHLDVYKRQLPNLLKKDTT